MESRRRRIIAVADVFQTVKDMMTVEAGRFLCILVKDNRKLFASLAYIKEFTCLDGLN